VTALVLSWWLGPRVIAWLKQLKFGQEYADKAEAGGGMAARILSKKGTPTMGGILIVVALNLTTLLWAQWNTLVQLTLLSVVVLTGLGFYDDYAKISQQSSGGRQIVRQARRASRAGIVHRAVFVAPAVHAKLITEYHGAVLQVSGPDWRRCCRAWS
jgi:UDP-N-acetylmuramyl pentapeptide phosphotransferase/UDP-N-acetylglucosamine-1-phosphate transferase